MNIYKKLLKPLVFAALLFSTGMTHANISLEFNPASQSGNSVDVDVVISGLGSGVPPSLSTYDLDIQFDNSHLSFSNVVFGDPVQGNQLDLFDFGLNDTSTALTLAGDLNIFELSLDLSDDLNSSQSGGFTLATVTFDVLKADTSQLTFSAFLLGDVDGNSLSADVTAATITTVPVPAAFWLMASGLGLFYKSRDAGVGCAA